MCFIGKLICLIIEACAPNFQSSYTKGTYYLRSDIESKFELSFINLKMLDTDPNSWF